MTSSYRVLTALAAFGLLFNLRLLAAEGPATVSSDAPPPYDPLPIGCKYYPHRATRVLPLDSVISNDYTATSYYAPEAIKRDVVCFGRDITVERLIRSNGGTILIVADHLTLNAPLDSRIYFWHSEKYWSDVPPGSPIHWAAASDAMRASSNVKKALDAWSLYHELYVPTSKTYQWAVDSSTNVDQRVEAFRDHELHTVASPQLPFGMMPHVEYGTTSGDIEPDAPTVPDRDSIRSGDIVLIVSKVDLCAECGPTADGAPDPTNGNMPFSYRAMLNASGANGGRGAPGGVVPAPTGDPGGDWLLGGISGKASRGGDAGNIEVIGIADTPNDLAQGQLAAVSRVLGGRGPYDGVRFNNKAIEFDRLGVRSDVTFQPFSANPGYFRQYPGITDKYALNPTLADLQGASGAITITTGATADQAIDAASSHISLLALHDYDVVSAARALARGDDQAGGFDPRHWFEHYLTTELIALELQVVDSARRGDAYQVDPASSSVLSHAIILSGLRCAPHDSDDVQLDHADLPDTTSTLATRLCDFSETGAPALTSFWQRSGGVFADIPQGIESRLQKSRENISSSENLAALNQIVGQLRDIDDTQYALIEKKTREEIQEKLNDLRAQADSVAADLRNNSPSLQDQLSAVGTLAGSVVQAVASGAAAYDEPSPATIGKAGQDLKTVYDKYHAWVNLAGNFEGLPEKLDSLRYQMLSLSGDMKSLDAAISRRRGYLEAAQATTLSSYVKMEANAKRAKDSIALEFTPMFRDQTERSLGFGGFALGGYSDGLIRIRTVLESFPDNEAVWLDGDLTNPCTGHNPMPLSSPTKNRVCVTIPADGHTGVLYSTSYPKLPLYVVPKKGPIPGVPVGPLGKTNLTLAQ